MANIVFLTNSYGAAGGVTSVVNILGNSLRKSGHNIRYVSLNDALVTDQEVFVVNTHRNWTIDHPLAKSFPGKYKHKYIIKALVTPLWRIWRNRRFISYLSALPDDSILVWTQTNIALQALTAGWKIGRQGLFEFQQFHSSYHGLQAMGHEKQLKEIVNSSKNLVVLTEADSREFADNLGISCYTLPNPVPRQVTSESLLKQNKIVYIGRLSQEKNILDAVTAFQGARTKDWVFEIYGTGPLEDEIKSYIYSNNLSSKIFLCGFTSTPLAVYQSARANILTSSFEGLPMSILEAATCGVPTISYDCSPGVQEIVHNTGWLVPPGNIKDLSKCIELLINEDKKGIREKSMACIDMAEKYSEQKIIEKWETIIEDRSLTSLPVRFPKEK
ncbi:glycosyltransferase [Rothia terrae]|uniref:glycosyltransferase n=1 Tax=Rothia terrae TaxID=396015 RepID=UPI00288165CC|nr:glycosyltransferase [Rothia terrae]MDT0190357.1 glycosyltransferase [Rothia terrae]